LTSTAAWVLRCRLLALLLCKPLLTRMFFGQTLPFLFLLALAGDRIRLPAQVFQEALLLSILFPLFLHLPLESADECLEYAGGRSLDGGLVIIGLLLPSLLLGEAFLLLPSQLLLLPARHRTLRRQRAAVAARVDAFA